jgi:hypothetical protein
MTIHFRCAREIAIAHSARGACGPVEGRAVLRVHLANVPTVSWFHLVRPLLCAWRVPRRSRRSGPGGAARRSGTAARGFPKAQAEVDRREATERQAAIQSIRLRRARGHQTVLFPLSTMPKRN